MKLEASPTPRAAPAAKAFKALSWNVAGLRAVFNNGNVAVLSALVEAEAPDALVRRAAPVGALRSSDSQPTHSAYSA